MIVVDWESVSTSRSHTGKFPVAWLEENDYSDAQHQAALSAAREPIVAVGGHLLISFQISFPFVENFVPFFSNRKLFQQ